MIEEGWRGSADLSSVLCPTVTWPRVLSRPRRGSSSRRLLHAGGYDEAAFLKNCKGLKRCGVVMSTLGTSYYVDSRIHPEQEEMAPVYSSVVGVEQAGQTMLGEYGGQETFPFQAKSSIFGGSWNPISSHASTTTNPTYMHHHYTPGESDGMFARTWALDPVSASMCLNGLPSTNIHYDIKSEPLFGGGDCTTLESRTPRVSSGGKAPSIPEMAGDPPPLKTAEESASAQERNGVTDASKLSFYAHISNHSSVISISTSLQSYSGSRR